MKQIKTKIKIAVIAMIGMSLGVKAQTLSEKQMQNARATGYSIIASKNPSVDFSVYVIPWDGENTLEYNANNQINVGWHAQAVVKGNYFYQNFDGNDFSRYSSVITSQEKFDQYKDKGTQWWIICSTIPPFSEKTNFKGKVGIGTTDTKGFELGVNGKIAANEVKVATYSNWPDFVFKNNHNIPTLTEVENHIKENGHLIDIPSAKEVEKNGFFLGEMDAKLLQKIEELTLYTIEQEKKIEKIQKENKSLKTMNLKLIELQKRLEKLEKK